MYYSLGNSIGSIQLHRQNVKDNKIIRANIFKTNLLGSEDIFIKYFRKFSYNNNTLSTHKTGKCKRLCKAYEQKNHTDLNKYFHL